LIQLVWFRENGENLQGFIGTQGSSDNYTKVKHISYEIEQQEKIFKQHILASNMTKEDGLSKEKQNGNIF